MSIWRRLFPKRCVRRPCEHPDHGGHMIRKHDYQEQGYWTGTSTPAYQCRHCGVYL